MFPMPTFPAPSPSFCHPPPPALYHVIDMPPPHVPVQVQPVWAWNFQQESTRLFLYAASARYVAVNVHYPGLVHLPDPGKDQNALTAEQRYALVKANVDALKPLQVGIAICDCYGSIFAWEFNLSDFRRLSDLHDGNSLAYLADRGLDADTFAKHGVDARSLGAMLLGSGLFRPSRGISWITYTGAYHVAYLLKIITGGVPLPRYMSEFVGDVRQFLGDQVYDVARMAAECPTLPVGLERIAANLGFHPPWRSPRLAGAAGVRALQVFRSMECGEFKGNLRRYEGLLQGLQC